MKRATFAVLFAFALFLVAPAVGAPSNTAFLSSVFGAQGAPSTCSSSTPLLDRDVGSLSALKDGARYLIAYQDRQSGGKGFVKEHVGGGLVEVIETAGAVIPAFQVDVVKVGSVALVPGRLYFTARAQDATPNEGPYALWCEDF